MWHMDRLSKEKRSWNMSRIRSSNTSLEIRIRRALYSRGFRYRIRSSLPGRPDLVFPGRKIAVFVNGCFWHMHGCKLSTIPSTRRDFWVQKLTKNKERDLGVTRELKALGWRVITLWECKIEENQSREISRITLMLTSPTD
jgi:DNA mismatch endonuclease (patch repair protein)